MKAKIKTSKLVDLKTIKVSAGVRYWEDANVNGVEDTDGTLIPCRTADYWCPVIDIDTGKITNWKQGITADIHYKVCDDGIYLIQDEKGRTVREIDGYVPSFMYPGGDGYGDYIIMKVNEEGLIDKWKFSLPKNE